MKNLKNLVLVVLLALTSLNAFGQEEAVEMKSIKYAVKMIHADAIKKAFSKAMKDFYTYGKINGNSLFSTDEEGYIEPRVENMHTIAVQNVEPVTLFENKECGKVQLGLYNGSIAYHKMQANLTFSREVELYGTRAPLSNFAFEAKALELYHDDFHFCLEKAYEKINEGVVTSVAIIGIPKEEYKQAKGETIRSIKTAFIHDQIRRLNKQVESLTGTLAELEGKQELQK